MRYSIVCYVFYMPLITMGLAGGVTVLQKEQHINQGERL